MRFQGVLYNALEYTFIGINSREFLGLLVQCHQLMCLIQDKLAKFFSIPQGRQNILHIISHHICVFFRFLKPTYFLFQQHMETTFPR